MKVAAATAIALLAREDVPDEVIVSAYGGDRPNMEKNILYLQRLIQDLFNEYLLP